jgi:hypothetical protein
MIARTRVDASTVKAVNKKGGKVTTTNTSVVSSDGKIRTVTTISDPNRIVSKLEEWMLPGTHRQ